MAMKEQFQVKTHITIGIIKMAKQEKLKNEEYGGHTIGFKKQWDATNQRNDISVQIYDDDDELLTGFYGSPTKKHGFEKAKKIIDEVVN